MSEELQNGKWSEWISNKGTQDCDTPLGYSGDRNALCEVMFQNYKSDSTEPINRWSWSLRGEWAIVKYRYWIPDTQTNPNTDALTEKEKDMNTWTDKDEEALKELLARKEKIEEGKRQKLEGAVSDIFWYNMDSSDLLRGMITHADELIEALEPYRKQK